MKLGGNRGTTIIKAMRRAASEAKAIVELRAAGATSLRAIAAELNERGIPAARGGVWSAARSIKRPFSDQRYSGAAAGDLMNRLWR